MVYYILLLFLSRSFIIAQNETGSGEYKLKCINMLSCQKILEFLLVYWTEEKIIKCFPGNVEFWEHRSELNAENQLKSIIIIIAII